MMIVGSHPVCRLVAGSLLALAGLCVALRPAAGQVRASQKLSDVEGGFTGDLESGDRFGATVTRVGDVDGNGVPDLAVGATRDDEDVSASGAVWIVFLNADGTAKNHQKITEGAGGFGGTLNDDEFFGSAVAGVGDRDGNGVPDLAVGAERDDDGGSVRAGSDRGGVWILYLEDDGTVRDQHVISATQGGFNVSLKKDDRFGSSLASIGDLDGDGNDDLAVGARLDDGAGGDFADRGAVYILFLNADETVRDVQKLADRTGGFDGTLPDDTRFGTSVASAGDVNDDGIPDLAVGTDSTVGADVPQGHLWVLLLNRDGTVQKQRKISSSTGGFRGSLGENDNFGAGLAGIGDRDADGVPDLIAGAPGDERDGIGGGAAWILYLDPDGTVTREQKISNTEGGFDGGLRAGEHFGSAVASAGDLDGDGTDDLAVGAPRDLDGAGNLPDGAGAVWMLFGEAPPPPLTLTVSETVTVSDVPQVLPSASLHVTETITVTDAPAAHPPARITVSETITVSDGPRMAPPAFISVTETIAVSDGPTVARPFKTLTTTLNDRWNLLSVPLRAPSQTFRTLLPDCSSGFFFEPGTGYTSISTDVPLPAGRGGFFHCQAGPLQITGQPVSPEIPVKRGWNIIGALDEVVATRNVTSTPGGIVASPFFRLDPNQGYVVASQLRPTEGYWVEAKEAGTLLLGTESAAATAEHSSTATPASETATDFGPGAVSLVVTDDAGHRATLHLLRNRSDAPQARSPLPPVPPDNVFDVRFASGRRAAPLPDDVPTEARLAPTVAWQGTSGPVRLRAAALPEDWTLHLRDAATGGTRVDVRLTADAPSVTVPSKTKFVTVTADRAPASFALAKSRPNPASRQATVEYALPTTTNVSIAVYDVLGRQVAQLATGSHRAGVHRAQLDVSDLPSGTYFVRMHAEDFTASRRLTVVQ